MRTSTRALPRTLLLLVFYALAHPLPYLPWHVPQSPPPQVDLAGFPAEWALGAKYAGTYERSEKMNYDAPIYVKLDADGDKRYLYRTDIGKWAVTQNEESIAKDYGLLVSSRATDLPTEVGLAWHYYDAQRMNETSIKCTEVWRNPVQVSSRASALG